MSRLFILLFFAVGVIFFVQLCWAWWFYTQKKKGNLDRKEDLTLFDVRELIIEGEKELAIKVYSEIFDSSIEESAVAVDQLERSIQEKNL